MIMEIVLLQLKQMHHILKLLLRMVILHLDKDKSPAMHKVCHLYKKNFKKVIKEVIKKNLMLGFIIAKTSMLA